MELLKVAASSSKDDQSVSRQVETLRDRLSSAMLIANQLATAPAAAVQDEIVTERYVRGLLQARRNRDRFFTSELFADPAWDMLLELYAAALGQFKISVSTLCVGAAVPATTALRWIKQLEDEGLVDRRPDPTDGRRHFLVLSHQGIAAMNAYFRTVPAGTSVI